MNALHQAGFAPCPCGAGSASFEWGVNGALGYVYAQCKAEGCCAGALEHGFDPASDDPFRIAQRIWSEHVVAKIEREAKNRASASQLERSIVDQVNEFVRDWQISRNPTSRGVKLVEEAGEACSAVARYEALLDSPSGAIRRQARAEVRAELGDVATVLTHLCSAYNWDRDELIREALDRKGKQWRDEGREVAPS